VPVVARIGLLGRRWEHKTSAYSRMDFGNKIEMLRIVREETPFPSAFPSAPPSKSRSEAETIQEAKRMEFPVVPDHSAPAAPQKKKRSKPSAKMSSYKQ
jgi:hypothetical protein